MGTPGPVRLFVVEDQDLFRRMLVSMCRDVWKFDVVGEARELADTMARVPKLKPDLLLLDLQLPDGDGIDLVGPLIEQMPGLRILALSSLRDDRTIHRLRRSGIHGFVAKSEQDPNVLREAILTVADGRMYFSSVVQAVHHRMREDPVAFPKVLSEREQAVVMLIARGCSHEEAGAELGITAATMQTHRRNIMRKLRLNTEADLLRWAIGKGFVRLDGEPFVRS